MGTVNSSDTRPDPSNMIDMRELKLPKRTGTSNEWNRSIQVSKSSYLMT